MALERLQKVLARGGFASRRASEEIIRAGRVRVNGQIVTELGTKVDTRDDKVEVDGKRVVAEDLLYVILHKPRGVVSTMSDPEGRPTVRPMLAGLGARVFPVGRLDFATSGALLATNDGDFAEGLLHPRRAVPKTYVVKVNGLMNKEALDRWRNGVVLDDGKTLPAEANFLRHEGDKTWFELTIKEGRNQQIRRMGEATGFMVMRLSRLSFAGVATGDLPPGKVRAITRQELVDLKKAYGVPRKIPSAVELEKLGEKARAPAKARPARAPRPPEQAPRPPEQGNRPQRRHEIERGARTDRSPGRSSGERGARASLGASSRTHGPRYGGGAPVRRGYGVSEDWGGGAARGHSSRDVSAEPLRGRGGSTTTGTGGGPKAAPGAYDRVKGRRPG